MSQLKLPKAEFIHGEIDYPEMIKRDYRKALLVIFLATISTVAIVAGLFVLAFFI
ncbi:MAG: hypothetical protein GNW80_07880 [Asgard group archaeon]|nr:hypothetical protein [Asgard group archaeon]